MFVYEEKMSYESNVKHKADWSKEINVSGRQPPKIITWDYRDRDELKTFFFSDVHLGHKQCDTELFKKNIKRVVDKQMPCIDVGDLIENSTRDSVGAGVYEQEDIAQEQIENAVELYTPLAEAGLLKSMQPGNHELRTHNSSGVNLTKIMAKMLDVPYGGVGIVHYIMVGNQRYTLYSTHGGGGSTTPAGKLNAMLRLEKIVNTDVYLQGHVHDTLYQARQFFDFNKSGKRLIMKKKHFVCNGAYLDYWGSYGQVKAYSPTNKGNAQINFNGQENDIRVSFA